MKISGITHCPDVFPSQETLFTTKSTLEQSVCMDAILELDVEKLSNDIIEVAMVSLNCLVC